MRFNVHGGHNRIVPGASALLDEVTEDRKVKDGIISRLRSLGHTAYDCTDDNGRTQGANLANIVAKCNKHGVDYDVSIHLNSGRKDKKGDGKTGGSEVFSYDHELKDVAKAVADAIAEEFGYALRSDSTTPSGYAGVKISKSLYVLANTKAPAMLIECCFVDDKDDAKVWNADRCAGAIVKGLTGKTVSGSSKPSGGSSSSSSGKKDLGNVDITYQAYTTKWWPAVKNKEDWAGRGDNTPIRYLAVKVSKGKIKGRVYTKKSGWLPYLTFGNSYNINDFENGCLGDGSDILAVELYYYTPDGYEYKEVHYRVSPKNDTGYYPVQIDNKKGSGFDGYAGDKKNYVDKFQAWIE